MPGIEVAGLVQMAVLWRFAGVDAYGQPTFGEAEEIAVRWDRHQSDGYSAQSGTYSYTASVLVAEDVPLQSAMWLGTIAELHGGEGDPSALLPQLDEAMVVKDRGQVPDVKGRFATRTLSLVRYRDAPPGS